jgi:hypothetical protein
MNVVWDRVDVGDFGLDEILGVVAKGNYIHMIANEKDSGSGEKDVIYVKFL